MTLAPQMRFRERLEQELTALASGFVPELRSFVNQYCDPLLLPVLQRAVSAKQTFDRALLARTSCKAVCGEARRALPAMLAIELLDISLMVIDDFFDEQRSRQGEETVYGKWGSRPAVIAGIVAKSMSSIALGSLQKDRRVSGARLAAALCSLEQVHQRIYRGQYQDIAFEQVSFDNVSLDSYLAMIKDTTGEEIALALSLGAVAGGGLSSQITAFSQLGLQLGVLAQIRDDLIDLVDDEALIGKTAFSDLRARKRRLPIIIAFQYADQGQRRTIDQMFQKKRLSRKDIDDLLTIIVTKRVMDRIRQLVDDLAGQAKECLLSINLPAEETRPIQDYLEVVSDV